MLESWALQIFNRLGLPRTSSVTASGSLSGHTSRGLTSLLSVVGLCLLASLMPTASAHAQPAPVDLETARGIALGTGVRASAASTSAAVYNASAMPLARVYHLEGFGGYELGTQRYFVGAHAVDSVTNVVAAGLSGRKIFNGSDDAPDGWDARLSIAFPLGEMLALGTTLRYMDFESEPNAEGDTSELNGFNVDVSMTAALSPSFRLAIVSQNLLRGDAPLGSRTVGASAAFMSGQALTLGGDLLLDFDTLDKVGFVAGGGLEYFAAGAYPLRAGYRWDGVRKAHFVTGGAGYFDQMVGVDLAVRQPVSGEAAGTELMISFRYFVN